MLGFYLDNTNNITSFGLDSSLLLVVVTTGIIGSLFFYKFIISIVKEMKLIKQKHLGNAVISITIASLVMSFFNNLLFYPLWLLPYLIIVNTVIVYFDNNKYYV